VPSNGQLFSLLCDVGAAAESAILAIAIVKSGYETKVLAKYNKPNGRRAVLDTIFGKKPAELERRFIESCFNLLAYWRDSACTGGFRESLNWRHTIR
jgi:hypothetical protein